MTSEDPAGAAGHRRVGLVLLHWENYPATERCLRSLEGLEHAPHTVYLLDNGSTDDSMDRLEREFAGRGIVFIRNGANLGFAAGCNPGIRRALDEGCDYVLLLNNDCVVIDKGFLAPALELAEREPRCGIVGGKIVFWPETTRIWSTGGFVRSWGHEQHIGTFQPDQGQYEQVAPRRFISGALMLIKRAVLERIGLLPDVYFFGKEEWEFSTRAHRAGFSLLYQPRCRVAHEMSQSHEWLDPTYVYNAVLSRILYQRRNRSRVAFSLWWLLYSTYVRVLLPLRARWQPRIFIRGMPPAVIHHAALTALGDSRGLERITGEMLDRFRKDHPREPAMARPGRASVSR